MIVYVFSILVRRRHIVLRSLSDLFDRHFAYFPLLQLNVEFDSKRTYDIHINRSKTYYVLPP